MRGRIVLKFILPSLAIIGMNSVIVLGQSTKPTSAPSAVAASAPLSKTDVSALEFLTKGLKEFEDGNNPAAQTIFADGLKVYGPPQTASASSNDTAAHVALNHAAAVTALRLNQLPPARTAMDRALGAKWVNDSLTFNAASIYTAIKGTAPLAVKLLDAYFPSHPNADESWVNLYGLALQKASETTTDAAAKAKLTDSYKTLDAQQIRLEKTQPGKHRWGSKWLTDEEWKEIQPKVDAAKRSIQNLENKVASDQKALQDIQQAAARQSAAPAGGGGGGGGRRGGGRRGGGGGGGGTPSQTPAQRAQQQLATDQAALAKARADAIQPEWDIKLVGITPVVEMTREDAPAPASATGAKPTTRRGP